MSIPRSALSRYGVALACTLLAIALRHALSPILGHEYPFITLFLAVAVAAWYGGFGPALMVTGLGMYASILYFMPPGFDIGSASRADGIGFLLYLSVGICTAALGGATHRARTRAEDAARQAIEQKEELRVTLASIGDAVIVTDAVGRISSCNPVAESLIGWPEAECAGQKLADVFTIVNERTREPVDNPVYRVLREGVTVGLANHTILIDRHGVERPIDDSAAPIRDADGALRGVVLIFRDISARREAEEALRLGEERLRLAMEAGGMGSWEWHILTNRVIWSPSLEAIHGLAEGGFPGTFEAYQQDIHPEDLGRVLASIRACLEEGRDHQLEYRLVWPDGSIHWIEARGKLFHDQRGRPERLIGTCMNIDHRKRLEEALHQELEERTRGEQALRFLADTSASLAKIVDYESTLQMIAKLSVPDFADWCAIDLLDPDGKLRRLSVAHVDPAKVQFAHELHRRYPPDPAAPTGVWNILRTGEPEIIPDISFLMPKPGEPLPPNTDQEQLDLVYELGLRSYIGVPLVLRGKTIGAITYVAAESGRTYDEQDLELAMDLANRASVAIDNARLYSELRKADRQKDEFLAMLAHELRNPLAPIVNALYVHQAPGANEATQRKALEIVERQVHLLTRLVEDLLDVSRIMRGIIELRPEPVDLGNIIARAIETAQPVIEASGHELVIDMPEPDLVVEADLVRLAQVVSNLLNNAAKYTDHGGRIELSARRQGPGAALEIRVRDSGIGITREMLPRIFDMFVQADSSIGRAQGGMGIGLTLVRRLVEMHGGGISAQSEGLGHGSEFIVRLPLAQPLPASVQLPPNGDDVASVHRPARRILIVDDNVDAADSLAVIFRLEGQEVRVAYDGRSAIASALETRPDLVFLDLGMPGMDGYEVAAQLRARLGPEAPHLVALTGWGHEEDRKKSRAAGFDRHLVKPVEPEAMRRLLAELG